MKPGALNNQYNTEDLIRQCMKKFDHFFLKKYSEKSIESYFRYVLSESRISANVPYSFKLFGTEEQAVQFADAFSEAARLFQPDYEIYQIHENRLLSGFPSVLPKGDNYGLFIQSDSSDELTESEIRKWDSIVDEFENTPHIVRFLYSSSGKLKERFRDKHSHLYYRIFPCDIVFSDPDADDIISLFTDEITDAGITQNEEFASGLQTYVQTVYPSADLKGYDFLRDLENRVIRLYNEKPDAGILDASCVPYSNKVNDILKARQASSQDAKVETPSKAATSGSEMKQVETPVPSKINPEVQEKICPIPVVSPSKLNNISITRKVERILLLALSTIPGYPIKLNHYVFVGDNADSEKSVDGYYQLEPVPKLLKDFDRPIDEIIILATRDSLLPPKSIPHIAAFENQPAMALVSAEDNTVGIDALSFFVYRISKYYSDRSPLYRVIEVPGDTETEKRPMISAMNRVLMELRAHNDADIYADIHGGLRDTQQLVSNILYLISLEERQRRQRNAETNNQIPCQRISSDNIYTVSYSGQGVSSVKNAGMTLSFLDFVTGMNDLINNGKVGSLDNYYQASGDSAAKMIISCLNNIAQGIQFCDIRTFENSKNLERLYDNIQIVEGESGDYLSLFAGRIKEDYARLLPPKLKKKYHIISEDDTGYRLLDEINWCMEKGFYQQVLTLIESKVPFLLHKTKKQPDGSCLHPVFGFDEIAILSDPNIDKKDLIRTSYWNGKPLNPEQTDLMSKNLFNQVVKLILGDNVDYLQTLVSGKNISIPDSVDIGEKYRNGSRGKLQAKYRNYSVVISDDNIDAAIMMKEILQLHFALKELRNIANHAVPSDNMDAIRNSFASNVKKYVEDIQELLSNPVYTRNSSVLQIQKNS